MASHHARLVLCVSAVLVPAWGAAGATPNDASDLDRWVDRHVQVRAIDVRLHVFRAALDSAEGQPRREYLERYSFSWPGMFKEAKFRPIGDRPPPPESYAGKLDTSVWAPWFAQAINGSGACVVEREGNSYEISRKPTSFSEHAPGWFGVSPWVVARYLDATGRSNINRSPDGLRMDFAHDPIRIVFARGPDGALELSEVHKLVTPKGEPYESVFFFDYHSVATLPFRHPGRSVLFRAPIVRGGNLSPASRVGKLVEHGRSDFLSVAALDPFATSPFEITIPAGLPPDRVIDADAPRTTPVASPSKTFETDTRGTLGTRLTTLVVALCAAGALLLAFRWYHKR